MFSAMTPWKNCRVAIFGTIISLIMFILAITLPFYSYVYFYQGTTMSFIDVINANHVIIIPFIAASMSIVFIIISLVFMMLFPKKKAMITVASILTFLSSFFSLAVFIIGLCRIWVIPYEFEYAAKQELLIGYILYVIFAFYHGLLSCYTLAINGK